MKIKMTKNTALTQLFYYAAMLSLLTGIIGFVILYATAISQGIPVFLVGTVAHLGTIFSVVDGAEGTPISSLIIAFLVRYRKTMLVIGLILTAIQAWLKHDAGHKLTLGNIFARPVSDGAVHPETRKEDKKPASGDFHHDKTHTDTIPSDVTTKRKEADTESASGSLTIRMNTSKTSSTGKGMKHLGDL